MSVLSKNKIAVGTWTPTAAGTYQAADWIPAGAVITKVVFNEVTNLVGGTDIKIRVGTTNLTDAVLTASVVTGNVALAGSATAIINPTTATINLVSTGTFTSGKIDGYVEYYIK